MTRVMVVEDDPQLVRALVINMQARHYGVDAAPRRNHDPATGGGAGADDYIAEPFGMDELLARLRAAVRRMESAPIASGMTLVGTEDLILDMVVKKATRQGHDVRLTPTEWHLLEILDHQPRPPRRAEGAAPGGVGVPQGNNTNYLRVCMAQLRRKLEKDISHPRYLITEPGMGYRFEA